MVKEKMQLKISLIRSISYIVSRARQYLYGLYCNSASFGVNTLEYGNVARGLPACTVELSITSIENRFP
jgi:hypothetical protein